MAITYSQAATAGFTTTPTLATPGSVTAGDLIIGIARYLNTGGNAPSGGASLSDNLNGSYASFQIVSDTSTQWYHYLAWVKATVTGTPTMTAGNFSGGGGFLSIITYTGFASNANILPADTITAHATASTSLSSGTVIASKNAELMFGWYTSSVGILTVEPPAGWTNRSIPAAVRTYDQLGISSGTNISMAGTYASSQNWNTGIQGFYDGFTAGPLMPFTSTQFFVTDTIIQQ